MSEKKVVKPVALAIGAALAGTFAISGAVNAEAVESPFEMSALSSGYMLGAGEGSCGEGSCGGDKDEKKGEGSCGEGSCGGDKKGEGSCGEKEGEGSCGEK
ncbi:MAG: HvfA family oxazolone/thioamide-modified RiPP metallophore, partial [Woeseiaceae bacterium]